MTHARFAQILARLAAFCAGWCGDTLDKAYYASHVGRDSVERFLREMRKRLDEMERELAEADAEAEAEVADRARELFAAYAQREERDACGFGLPDFDLPPYWLERARTEINNKKRAASGMPLLVEHPVTEEMIDKFFATFPQHSLKRWDVAQLIAGVREADPAYTPAPIPATELHVTVNMHAPDKPE